MRRFAAGVLAILLPLTRTDPLHAAVAIELDGPTFVVNELQYGAQVFPDVAIVGAHEALVVWMGPHAEGARGGGIWARYLDDKGPLGEELLLSPTHTTFATFNPKVASSNDGFSAAIFETKAGNQDNNGGVYLRTLDPDGASTDGGEIQVQDDLIGFQSISNVVAGDDASYLVSWYDQTNLVSSLTLLVRRFDADGNPRSEAVPIAEGSLYSLYQTRPVAALPGGRYVAAWSSLGDVQAAWIGEDTSVSAPRVLASGTPTAQPSVLACEDGRHLVVWSAPDEIPNGTKLLGQWLDANGDDIGGVQVLASHPWPWGGYDTPYATMMPGCTALLQFGYRLLLATPDGVAEAGFFSDEFVALAAESDRRFLRVTSPGYAPDTEVQAEWFCLLRDDDARCGDATCVGDADATGNSRVNVRDALRVLHSAIGLTACSDCRCDSNGSGTVTVTDAARILRFSVGHPVELLCPDCVVHER